MVYKELQSQRRLGGSKSIHQQASGCTMLTEQLYVMPEGRLPTENQQTYPREDLVLRYDL